MHGWGLYAAGPVAANVFVIEYIGELLRRPLDDVREKVRVMGSGGHEHWGSRIVGGFATTHVVRPLDDVREKVGFRDS